MEVMADGCIKLPQHVREKLELGSHSEVDFIEEQGRFYLIKRSIQSQRQSKFRRFRGVATVKMSADEIMKLTRGES